MDMPSTTSHPDHPRASRNRIWLAALVFLLGLLSIPRARAADSALVFLTDFSLRDGAVSAMKGVAFGVDPRLPQFDITHEIPPFNVWEGAFRLQQAAPFWPSNTVFVCVVDPGVGTDRLPVVSRTRSGHLFVGPDNGLFTLVDEHLGFDQARVIDATRHRLPGSAGSYTFHGRDLFAYVGAQLATGKLRLDDVGPRLTNAPTRIPYQHAALTNGTLAGVVPVLDIQYGNVWSNIGRELFEQLGAKPGDRFEVRLLEKGRVRAKFEAPYATTFGEVPEGKPLLFLNSLHNVAVALNQASLAQRYRIGSGPDWTMQVRPLRKASSGSQRRRRRSPRGGDVPVAPTGSSRC